MDILATENFSGRTMSKVANAWVAGRSWTVTGVDNEYDAIEQTVAHASGHPQNGSMRVFSRSATPKGGGLSWTAVAQYKFGDVGLGADNPMDEPPQVLPDVEQESQPTDFDLNHNAVVNSAGDPYDPSGTTFVPVGVYTIKSAVPFFDVSVQLAVADHVNQAAITLGGFGDVPAGNAYCFYYRPSAAYTAVAPYVFVEAKIGVKAGTDPWQPRVVDQGRWGWYLDSNGAAQKGRICDSGGNPVDFDVRLNGAGKPIDPRFYILPGADSNIDDDGPQDPIANPAPPPGLSIDAARSSATIKILIWKQKAIADFTPILG